MPTDRSKQRDDAVDYARETARPYVFEHVEGGMMLVTHELQPSATWRLVWSRPDEAKPEPDLLGPSHNMERFRFECDTRLAREAATKLGPAFDAFSDAMLKSGAWSDEDMAKWTAVYEQVAMLREILVR